MAFFRVYDPLFAENKAKNGDLSSKPLHWLQDNSGTKSQSLSIRQELSGIGEGPESFYEEG